MYFIKLSQKLLILSYVASVTCFATGVNLPISDDEATVGQQVTTYKTPLQQDADNFLKVWKNITEEDFKEGELSKNCIDYINKVIIEDGYKNFPTKQKVYNLISLRFIIAESDKTEEFTHYATYNDVNYLYNCFSSGNLIECNSPNTFANYFIGFFLSPLNSNLKYASNNFNIYLEQASKNFYNRATSLLLQYPDWRQQNVNSQLLNYRNNFTSDYDEALLSFLEQYPLREQLKWNHIDELEKIILFKLYHEDLMHEYLLSDIENAYNALTKVMRNFLMNHREERVSWKTNLVTTFNSLASGALSLTIGIGNINQGYDNGVVQRTIFSTGLIQVSSSLLQFSASVINTPYFYNLLSRTNTKNLLPITYSDSEIAIQSRVIALTAIVKNNLKNIKKLNRGSYTNHLKKLILKYYSDEKYALHHIFAEIDLNKLKVIDNG